MLSLTTQINVRRYPLGFRSSGGIRERETVTAGAAHVPLNRIGGQLGFDIGLKIHSPRAWIATCANQLLYPREDREKLGRWAPGSLMPDIYDRARCTAELSLMGEIINRIRSGRVPTKSFETPADTTHGNEIPESSPASSTSATPPAESDVDISDLRDEKRETFRQRLFERLRLAKHV